MEFDKIAQIISSALGIDVADITPASTFESFKVDSLDMVEIIMDIESEFNVAFGEDVQLNTVSDIVDYVKANA